MFGLLVLYWADNENDQKDDVAGHVGEEYCTLHDKSEDRETAGHKLFTSWLSLDTKLTSH